MNFANRLSSELRRARRLRAARTEIARAERAIEKRRRRQGNPGYDELSDPLFIGVMVLAVYVLVMDIRGDIDTSVIAGWIRSVAVAARSWA